MKQGPSFWYCKNFVADVLDISFRREIVTKERNWVHRAAQKNVKQVKSEYYFPKMTKLANDEVLNCKIWPDASPLTN